ncbi:ABC transporter ATP-binding protein [Nesterenkonia sp. HG001]|uniref:ABC transporter ATP-binding protein n=1 Tax=Nesterenkonia sp. HG001 TaxID=2983207 RepID=UPI002AC47C11|nr:ABC transporter ATP-binding protein [Nesterenkonia sp. HG001]MDZ5077363.1 ABC transporter ATP-binding protein/permease [Nesterenkonia sp. HG001]
MNLVRIISGHRALLVAGIVAGLVGAAASLAQPLFVGILIRAVAEGDSISGPILWIVGLFILDAAMSAANAYLIGRAGENIVFDVRNLLAGRLLRSRVAAFQRMESGDIFTRMVGDTTLACMVITQALAQLVSSLFMVVGGVIFMAWIDWQLLVATLICLGAASLVSLVIARQVRVASLVNRTDTSAFGSGLQRVLGAITTVKASRAEARETERLEGLADSARQSGIRVTALGALLQPAMNVGTQLSLAVVIAWGMARVTTGELHAADLTAFVMYLFYLVSPLVMLFLALGQIQQGRAAVQRITELAELPQEEEPQAAGAAEDSTRGEMVDAAVAFESVWFSYEDGSPALRDVTFSVPRTGLTAIVGPSGAGKTSLFQLVERFHRADRGAVSVSGVDVAEMSLDQLRTKVGYVEQDAPLLRGTIRENLVYARPEAEERQIEEVLRLSSLKDFVESLPQGLDTELGERGLGLSGGQRQRLAIARTLLQQPEVVLLDEVTAHLDSDTEAALRDAVIDAAQQRAVVTIAHRISTVLRADRIIVLDRGAVRAIGTHAELMESDEVYRRLAEQQLQASGVQ